MGHSIFSTPIRLACLQKPIEVYEKPTLVALRQAISIFQITLESKLQLILHQI
jgi:hypothetical protein